MIGHDVPLVDGTPFLFVELFVAALRQRNNWLRLGIVLTKLRLCCAGDCLLKLRNASVFESGHDSKYNDSGVGTLQ